MSFCLRAAAADDDAAAGTEWVMTSLQRENMIPLMSDAY